MVMACIPGAIGWLHGRAGCLARRSAAGVHVSAHHGGTPLLYYGDEIGMPRRDSDALVIAIPPRAGCVF
jgi:glycosidase